MNNSKAKRIATLGVMTALLIVVFTLETVIGAVWITPPAIFSLSILFTLCFMDDIKTGFLSGVIFGVVSEILAVCIANPLFIIPWISILPRLFVGISAYAIFKGIKFLFRKSDNKFLTSVLPYSIGAGMGIIINTALVVLCLTLFAPSEYGNTFNGWMKAVITLNFPIELLAGIILTPVFSNIVAKIKHKA